MGSTSGISKKQVSATQQSPNQSDPPLALGDKKLLKQGRKNDPAQVKQLVELLRAESKRTGVSFFSSKYKPSGTYDEGLAAAVRKYQKAKGLNQDGIVGQQTWAALMGVDSARRVKPGTELLAKSKPAEPRSAPPADWSDGFVSRADASKGQSSSTVPTATVDSVSHAGQRNQLVEGTIVVNGQSYRFRSGGFGNGSIPTGDYEVTAHRWQRSEQGMNVGGEGYSFALSNKFDPRTSTLRDQLRIHPDGGSAGTEGCLGIVGNAEVQRQFRHDMAAELARNGGSFTLTIK